MSTVATDLREALQPVYAQLLENAGIATGDIDPGTQEELEAAELRLAAVVARWIDGRVAEERRLTITMDTVDLAVNVGVQILDSRRYPELTTGVTGSAPNILTLTGKVADLEAVLADVWGLQHHEVQFIIAGAS